MEETPDVEKGCNRETGIVVTDRYYGNFVHAVYGLRTRRVFLMPEWLFEFDIGWGMSIGMSRSRCQKLQQMYEFGDEVTFDANDIGIVKQVVHRGPTTFEAAYEGGGHFMVCCAVLRWL